MEVRILRGQPASPTIREFPGRLAEKPANSGLWLIRLRSLYSHFAVLCGQAPKSLRLNSRIFPFSGDRGWRLGSIPTACGGLQSHVGKIERCGNVPDLALIVHWTKKKSSLPPLGIQHMAHLEL